MAKRLFLDLEKFDPRKGNEYSCNYRFHPCNSGMNALLENTIFTYICRHCDEAPCVNSCPKDALEKLPGADLKRFNNRCISCKSCMIACPFGTIVPQVVPYLSSMCDLCIGRLKDGEVPVCVKNCNDDVLEYKEVEEAPEKNVYILNEYLAVHCMPWTRPGGM